MAYNPDGNNILKQKGTPAPIVYSPFGLHFNNYILCFSSEFTVYKLMSSYLSLHEIFFLKRSDSDPRLTRHRDISKSKVTHQASHCTRSYKGLESAVIATEIRFLLLFLLLDPQLSISLLNWFFFTKASLFFGDSVKLKDTVYK